MSIGSSNGNGVAKAGVPPPSNGMPAVHIPKVIKQNVQQKIQRDPYPVIPHISTYSGRYNVVNQSYNVYWDQALIDSQQNTLVMRRDGFCHELIRHRQLPIISLPPYIEMDDPDDPGQKSIAETALKIFQNIPRIKSIMLSLMEAIFYGRYGVQIQIGPRKVAGNEWNSVVRSVPVNGDKFRMKWDGTPGIAIYNGAQNDQFDSGFLKKYENFIETSMLGMALYLKNSFLRDRFIIHQFEPSDTDYLFEIQEAQSVFGLGLRSRYYWTWNLRTELLSWMVDALQRVGANGMLYAAYDSGNYEMQNSVLKSLAMLVKDNIAAFPRTQGSDLKDMIERIEPSAVGYDVMMGLIQHLEGWMRRGFLGQDLSSESKPLGIGGGAAGLHADVRRNVMEYDADNLAETLTEQLLAVILRYNKWKYDGKIYSGDDLPFSLRLKFQMEEDDAAEKMGAAESLFNMGVPLDMDDVRKIGGFSPPKKNASILVNPQIGQQQQQLEAGVPGVSHLAGSLKGLVGVGKDAQKLGMTGGMNGGGNGSMKPSPSRFIHNRIDRFGKGNDPEDIEFKRSRFSESGDCGHDGDGDFSKGNTCAAGDGNDNDDEYFYIRADDPSYKNKLAIPPKNFDKKVPFYHWTSIDNMSMILDKGIKPGVSGGEEDDPDMPRQHAVHFFRNPLYFAGGANQRSSKKVLIGGFMPREFVDEHGTPDDDYYTSARGEKYGDAPKYDDDLDDWRSSYLYKGNEKDPKRDYASAAVSSTIKPEFIKKLKYGDKWYTVDEFKEEFKKEMQSGKKQMAADWVANEINSERYWNRAKNDPEYAVKLYDMFKFSKDIIKWSDDRKEEVDEVFNRFLLPDKKKSRLSKSNDCGHDSDGSFSAGNKCAVGGGFRKRKKAWFFHELPKNKEKSLEKLQSKYDKNPIKEYPLIKYKDGGFARVIVKKNAYYARMREEKPYAVEVINEKGHQEHLAYFSNPEKAIKSSISVHKFYSKEDNFVFKEKSKFSATRLAKAGDADDCGHERPGEKGGRFTEGNTCAGEGKSVSDNNEKYDYKIIGIRGSSGSIEQLNSACKIIFGREIKPEEILDLCAAGAIREKINGFKPKIRVENNDTSIKVSFENSEIAINREISKDLYGNTYIYNDYFRLENTGEGFGTSIYSDQIENAIKSGVSYIKCSAGRSETMNGYYAWPRLGYDGFIPDHIIENNKKEIAELIGKSETYIDNNIRLGIHIMVSDLMKSKKGREFWKENGETFEAKFDLKEGSLSRRVLSAYLKEKGKDDPESPDRFQSRSGVTRWPANNLSQNNHQNSHPKTNSFSIEYGNKSQRRTNGEKVRLGKANDCGHDPDGSFSLNNKCAARRKKLEEFRRLGHEDIENMIESHRDQWKDMIWAQKDNWRGIKRDHKYQIKESEKDLAKEIKSTVKEYKESIKNHIKSRNQELKEEIAESNEAVIIDEYKDKAKLIEKKLAKKINKANAAGNESLENHYRKRMNRFLVSHKSKLEELESNYNEEAERLKAERKKELEEYLPVAEQEHNDMIKYLKDQHAEHLVKLAKDKKEEFREYKKEIKFERLAMKNKMREDLREVLKELKDEIYDAGFKKRKSDRQDGQEKTRLTKAGDADDCGHERHGGGFSEGNTCASDGKSNNKYINVDEEFNLGDEDERYRDKEAEKNISRFHRDMTKENYGNWSSSQKAAIAYYADQYGEINNYMRNGSRVSDEDKRRAKEIESALSRSKIGKNMILYRGIKDVVYLSSHFDTKYPDSFIGAKITDNGFTSTSISKYIANDFYRESRGSSSSAIVKIEADADTEGSAVGNYRKEYEVLLNRGHTIEITGHEKDSQGRFVLKAKLLPKEKTNERQEPGSQDEEKTRSALSRPSGQKIRLEQGRRRGNASRQETGQDYQEKVSRLSKDYEEGREPISSTDKSITREQVGKILATQYHKVKAIKKGKYETSPAKEIDKWVTSSKFKIMNIPLWSVRVYDDIPAGNHSHSTGPIVVDRLKDQPGKKRDVFGPFGLMNKIVCIDGKHRLNDAREKGKESIQAYVGDAVYDELKNHIATFGPIRERFVEALERFYVSGSAHDGSEFWDAAQEAGIADKDIKKFFRNYDNGIFFDPDKGEFVDKKEMATA